MNKRYVRFILETNDSPDIYVYRAGNGIHWEIGNDIICAKQFAVKKDAQKWAEQHGFAKDVFAKPILIGFTFH